MARERITLTVTVDLDPVPGVFHTPESARDMVQAVLNTSISHYDPTVTINKE